MFHTVPKANDFASSLKAVSPKNIATDGARSISLLSGSLYLFLEPVSAGEGAVMVVAGVAPGCTTSVVPFGGIPVSPLIGVVPIEPTAGAINSSSYNSAGQN